ncbi:MAG: hypothetical protein AAF337_03175 [Pseudomonadota bacterium]
MKVLLRFFDLCDLHVLIITVITAIATYVCIAFGFRAELPSTLIAVAIVFPIAFSINAAYQRREQALSHLASFRATTAALYWAHRDWAGGNAGQQLSKQAEDITRSMYGSLITALTLKDEEQEEATVQMYRAGSQLSKSHEDLRVAGVSPTEISRANNYLRMLLVDMERLLVIAQYRTPSSLRAFSKVFLNIFPIIYAPFYAYIAQETSAAFGYAVAIAFSLVLVGLDNVQDRLEDPFDGLGDDDVKLKTLLDLSGDA